MSSLTSPLVGVLLLGLLIWVPGGLALTLIRPSKKSPTSLLSLFIATALGQMLVGLLGIALASVGHFRPIWLATGVAILSLLLFAGGHRSGQRLTWPGFSRWDGVALGLLLIVALIFARPHENVIVGRDPGVYTNTAIHLARSGKWTIDDPFFADLPPSTQAAFLSYVWHQGPFRLPGFFWVTERDLALSQFLPFFTVWMALLEWLFGPGGGLWAALLFTLTGALGLAGFAARFWKPRTACFLLLLLLSNPAAIWYARSANSEVALQVLLLLLVSLWTGRHRQSDSWAGPLFLAGTLAAALLDKLDMLYLLPAFFAVYGLAWLIRPKSAYYWRTALSILLAIGIATAYMWQFSVPYLRLSFNFLSGNLIFRSLAVGLGLLVGGALIVGCLGGLRRRLWAKYRDWVGGFSGLTRSRLAVIAIVLGLLYLVLYFVLPATVPVEQVADKRLSLVKVGWYVTPVGLILSGLGALTLFLKRPPRGSVLLLVLCTTALFLNLMAFMTDQIFGIRRLVAFAIPGLLLLSAGGLENLARWRPRRMPAAGLGAAILLGGIMLVGQAANSRILLLHREFEGARQTLQQLGSSIPLQSVIVFGNYDSLLGTFLGPNLWLEHDLEPLYASRPLALEDWQSVCSAAQRQSRPLFAIDQTRPPSLPGVDTAALRRVSWHLPELERTFEHFPSQIDSFDFDFTVWQLSPGSGVVRYEPAALLSRVGKMVTVGDRILLQGQGESGYLSYGPYHKFAPGRYVARFWLSNLEALPKEVILDVTPAASPPLAQLNQLKMSFEPTTAPQPVEVPFVISGKVTDIPIEFRVFLPDGGIVNLEELEIVPLGESNESSDCRHIGSQYPQWRCYERSYL